MKDGKLKSKDFLNSSEDLYITFKSTKFVQTGPDSMEVQGTLTIRGVSRPEKLHFTMSGKGTGSGEIKGTMAFDRNKYIAPVAVYSEPVTASTLLLVAAAHRSTR